MFVYHGVWRSTVSLSSTSHRPPASLFVPLCCPQPRLHGPALQRSCLELLAVSPPSLLLTSCPLSSVKQLNVCFYWKMLWVLLG